MAAHFSEELEAAIRDAGAIVRTRFPWWLRLFLVRGVVGITLGRRIYLASADVTGELLRHELAHVRQVSRFGILGFYCRYLVEFVRNLGKGMSFDAAYRNISFEREAFAAETYNRPTGTAG
jgi:hypothetical protein